MKHIRPFEEFVNEGRDYLIKGTPFKVYWGGGEVEGQLKWVVTSDDEKILDTFLEDNDQLWYSKNEAEQIIKDWWKKNSSLFESYEIDSYPKSIAQVNAFLKSKNLSEKLKRGNGYFYFSEGESYNWSSNAVYVYRIDDMTFGDWYDEYKKLSKTN